MNRYYNVLSDILVFNKQFYAPYMNIIFHIITDQYICIYMCYSKIV